MTTTNISEIDTSDGGMIVLPGSRSLRQGLTDAMIADYVSALVGEATDMHGVLWVRAPSKACVDAVRAVWDVIAPGWTSDLKDRSKPSTDENLAALIAHSGIMHHLRMVGADTLRPARAQARRVLAARPDLAARTVQGYLGYEGISTVASLADLLAVDGSCVARAKEVLDTDAFDDLDITRFDRVLVRGEAAEMYILQLARS